VEIEDALNLDFIEKRAHHSLLLIVGIQSSYYQLHQSMQANIQRGNLQDIVDGVRHVVRPVDCTFLQETLRDGTKLILMVQLE
jgi:hypothetical protein